MFTVDTSPQAGNEQIAVLDYETGESEVIIPAGSHPKYSPTGHIVYGAAGTLRAVTFDLDTLTVTGDPVPVVEGVLSSGGNSAARFDLSATGSLVYVTGSGAGGARPRSFVWVDREGNENRSRYRRGHTSGPGSHQMGPVSPSLTHLTTQERRCGYTTSRVVAASSSRRKNLPARLSGHETGERLVFGVADEGQASASNLYWARADGSGEIEALTTFEPGEVIAVTPSGMTPDGQTLIFAHIAEVLTTIDVWGLPLDGERVPVPLLQRDSWLSNGHVSPDGRWLSYQSDEAGEPDVYLQPYPDLGPIVRVSLGGGTSPVWSPDGSELFYRNGTSVMATTVDSDDGGSTVGTQLFDGDYVVAGAPNSRQYNVAPDGRFLMMIRGDAATPDDDIPNQVVLVQNWFEELTRLVPVN